MTDNASKALYRKGRIARAVRRAFRAVTAWRIRPAAPSTFALIRRDDLTYVELVLARHSVP